MKHKLDLNKRNEYRSLAFWSWNGKMEDGEIIRQIRDFERNGYGGFFIHARAGLEIPYMKESWYHACEIAIKEAEKYGLSVWIYDEDGWPSGFAGGMVPEMGVDFQFKEMHFKTMQKGDSVPGHMIAGYRRTKNGEMPEYQRVPAEEADLVIYFKADPHYVDLLNPEVTRAFIQTTHEEYKKRFGSFFGTTIKGCFADEPQLNNTGYTWSTSLEEHYNGMTGRDLLDDLWKLPCASPEYNTIRHDYWNVVGSLYRKSFTDRIGTWCSENNLEFTGHFACEDGLCDQISSNGGVMRMYPAMQLPGIDHLGRRIASPVLMKQVSSVAEQYGKSRILSETFGCTGWNLNFTDMLWIWGYQCVLGINLPCLHLSAYTIKGVRKRDYPAFFSYQEPWWEQFREINVAFSGMNLLLSQGKSDHRVLVVSPLSGMWTTTVRPGHSQDEMLISSQYRQLIENLLFLQIGFDIGDESLLVQDGRIEGNHFILGEGSYDMVFVCQTPSIPEKIAGLYREFLNNNGTLLFVNQIPQSVEGTPFNICADPIFQKAVLIQNRKDLLRKYFDFCHFDRSISFFSPRDEILCDQVLVRTRDYDEYKIVYLWNRSLDSERILNSRIRGIQQVEVLDPRREDLLNGESVKTRYDGEQTCFDISLPVKGHILFKITPCAETSDDGANYLSEEKASLNHWRVQRKDYNALTLDTARYSLNHGGFGRVMPVIHLQDELYDKISELSDPADVCLQYEFTVSDQADLNRLNLAVAAETMECKAIRVNGISFTGSENGWWIDRCILQYQIGAAIRHGSNQIEVDYRIPLWRRGINVDEVFETERNRFHYPVGLEAVYIRGDFTLEATGMIKEKSEFWSIGNAEFIIKNADRDLHYGEMTSQGLWFYRGDISMVQKISINRKNQEEEYFLEWNDQCVVLAEVRVNGAEVAKMIAPPYRCCITPALKEGENEVELTLYGSNRNLLGPHHHIKGEPCFTGPSTFLGKRGYEDFVSADITEDNTWTNDYSFVKTGIRDSVCIVKESRLLSI